MAKRTDWEDSALPIRKLKTTSVAECESTCPTLDCGRLDVCAVSFRAGVTHLQVSVQLPVQLLT